MSSKKFSRDKVYFKHMWEVDCNLRFIFLDVRQKNDFLSCDDFLGRWAIISFLSVAEYIPRQ